MTEQETIIFVHGIWMPGAEMTLLRRRLARSGYRTLQFSYPSVRRSLDGNALELQRFITSNHLEQAHVVGHSLGGIVSLRAFAISPWLPPGRIVCLGSPLCGSIAANRLDRFRVGRRMLGMTIHEGVMRVPAAQWARGVVDDREVGVVAGTVPLGLGRIVTRFDEPNDGTVALSETRIPGAADHIEVPVNHTALVTSSLVAGQVDAFLRQGRFER